jgi:hypothetical protein
MNIRKITLAVAAALATPLAAIAGGSYLTATAAKVAGFVSWLVTPDLRAPSLASFGVNGFTKQETAMFDELLAGYDDALVASKLVNIYQTDQTIMERSNDQIWRPQPYITQSFSGLDQTANFGDIVQLSVPAYINTIRSSPWVLTANELRDAMQEGRIRDGAKQKLASDINVDVNAVVCALGSLVVKRTTAAAGFDDVALIDSVMNEQGVPMQDRVALYSSRDYNNMASNLAGRGTVAGPVQTAYERAFVARVSNIDIFKMDYAPRQAAATATTVTVNGANQRYVPTAATLTAGTLTPVNTDNRFQNLAITVGASTVKVGDMFTMALVNAVHHITKVDTGQLKTFRVVAIVSGGGGTGTIQITPPIIAADSAPTAAELQYKNVTVTPANGAAIVFLNTLTAAMNPFWYKGAIDLLPGRLVWPSDGGLAVMSGATDQGMQLTMCKQAEIKTGKVNFRVDTKYGVAVTNTEMCGVEMFSQP